MEKIKVTKIRPVSWNIYTQGREAAERLRPLLAEAQIETSDPEADPSLTDPPVYVLRATPSTDGPLTTEELAAILAKSEQVELPFSAP